MNLPFLGPINEIDLGPLTLKLWRGRSGILCSGGADSTLLLYLLMQYTNNPINIYTIGVSEKGRTNAITTAKIIEKCIQLTSNENIEHIVTYGSASDLYKRSQKDLLFRKISVLYSGMTKNPPLEVTNNFRDPLPDEQIRNPKESRQEIYRSVFYRPFTNKDKKDICELYKEFGVLDELFPLTHSCEGGLNKLNHFDHCGKCWWCEERKWGFGKL